MDRDSGYRYYSASQLPRLHRILALRDLGFSLDQIRTLIEEGVTSEQLRGMLRLRLAEQQDRVANEQQRLDRVRARLNAIEREGNMSQDVIIKEVGPQWIASVRATIPAYNQVGPLYGELLQAVGSSATGPCIAPWHDPDYREENVDAEAGIF